MADTMTSEKDAPTSVESAAAMASDTMTANQIAEAYKASLREHQMGFWSAVKTYKKALAWTAVVCLAIIMEGYDLVLINQLVALPSFKKTFGHRLKNGTYQLTASWQSGVTLVNNVGLIIGIFSNGWLIDMYGQRRVIMVALITTCALIPLLFWAKSIGMILAGELLLGIPLGNINTAAPAYAIEVAPLALRHYGPTYVNLCIVFGHIVTTGILRGLVNNTTNWAWRIPYAVQWAWPPFLVIALLFAPESPWWLVRKNRMDQARKTLDRLSSADEVDNEQYLAMIQHTINLERQLKLGGSYSDCFKGSNLRRTEIACVTWSAQAWTGFGLITGTYFFSVEGLSPTQSFDLGLVQYILAGAGSMIGTALLQRIGRRQLWFVGLFGMMLCCVITGGLALTKQTSGVIWAQGVLIMCRQFAYGIATGPIPFVYCSEIGSVKLRAKTLALSRNAYNASAVISSAVGPFLINPTAANLKGKSAWISTGFCVLITIWSYYRFPETKGRTFEELDVMFENKIPARGFRQYVVERAEVYGSQYDEKLGEIEHETAVTTEVDHA